MTATTVALAMLVAAMALGLARLIRGPHLGDRIVAGDTIALIVINLVAALGVRADTRLYADVAAVIAILGFIGTVAAARYLRGRPPLA
ncbi:MAG: monovalent cation/H+ antiporter complex subunit F [Armatimonadota bacterium]|nr:monovalent cation/H+ antiporter complex subunit F [Armatimonadota bacterium]MDR7421918.1 monovalent cation/H+ antiporter complex subunit F [Armatimonadota bacterium]MDR7454449.1 monovalent cation/H+ antiporter complex subunit F [Armatimonadota bacterium]MDR7457213.1 monovalent cation/H+ antiporter complex subunit F [Armatimonadota bacterium]MDR7497284.1 monovalent cation/H+ antiporter complex subunit F [Armatimonadota bacterium]